MAAAAAAAAVGLLRPESHSVLRAHADAGPATAVCTCAAAFGTLWEGGVQGGCVNAHLRAPAGSARRTAHPRASVSAAPPRFFSSSSAIALLTWRADARRLQRDASDFSAGGVLMLKTSAGGALDGRYHRAKGAAGKGV